ncbi:hypothetical protein Back2_29240 [Nocardioides baekrokdamisoli]|uniref:DUF2568 domain-containing protein n=1 Tax=Nocardioides baekrokdamisoli TaxID=1804624 RepID=A0A3G9II36_9ACTN|nr:DUF2568 domain-containing protein [Nocardioides baekrokdamisoli]BBH18637.1 hypothetical protein Back2_29240 [Nocardioides baekrokdamisoli]
MAILILALVFLDEVLAAVAAGVWGGHVGVFLAVVMPIVVVLVWWAFASPKARWGGPVVRPLTKVIVFGLASAGLWAAGHHALAIAMLAFSVVINALAQMRSVRAAMDALGPTGETT